MRARSDVADLLSIPRQLAPPSMVVFAIGIENPFDVAIQGRHDADPREHRRAAQRRDQHQRFDCGFAIQG